jgi:DeoR family transcriptional regulator, aga operon transcriptional repressor
MARQAARVVVVADSSKASRRAFARICSPGEIDVLVTDAGLGEGDIARFADAGIDVMTA